ncbi:MAG: transporter substrate-binding domain-containing protein [Cyclobacteriaceae bacterium]|nr:transporter substrate-binding domain-containing protein [Cyclobacteriaceae bacterium]
MKTFLLIFLTLLTVKAQTQKLSGDSWEKVKTQGGTLTVVYCEQPGLIYKNETTGKLEGVCKDILDDFAAFVQKNYGKTVTINYALKEQTFSKFLQIAQQTPNIMGISNVTITDERKKIMKFTPAYMSNLVVLLTHKDAPSISSLTQIGTVLNGYTAKVLAGSTHGKVIEKIKKEYAPNLKISYANSGVEIMNELNASSSIFTVLDFTEYINASRKHLPVKRHNVNVGTTEELGFIMSKQSDWDKPWNEFLTIEYRKSVRYRKIIVDNLGANFLNMVK